LNGFSTVRHSSLSLLPSLTFFVFFCSFFLLATCDKTVVQILPTLYVTLLVCPHIFTMLTAFPFFPKTAHRCPKILFSCPHPVTPLYLRPKIVHPLFTPPFPPLFFHTFPFRCTWPLTHNVAHLGSVAGVGYFPGPPLPSMSSLCWPITNVFFFFPTRLPHPELLVCCFGGFFLNSNSYLRSDSFFHSFKILGSSVATSGFPLSTFVTRVSRSLRQVFFRVHLILDERPKLASPS